VKDVGLEESGGQQKETTERMDWEDAGGGRGFFVLLSLGDWGLYMYE